MGWKGTEAQRKALAEGRKKGAQVMRTHGVTQLLALSPERWPKPIRDMYQRRYLELSGIDHIDMEKDSGAVAAACRLECVLARLYSYLMDHRAVNKKGQPVPILRCLYTYENTLAKAYAALGLSPTARSQLRLKDDQNIKYLQSLSDEDTDDGVEDAETENIEGGR